MKITDTIRYAGVNDHQVDLFEGQYKVPNGMSYNSYVILDDKIAVMDTVDANFTHEWLDNIQQILDGRRPDYLIVQHMEPDHAANGRVDTSVTECIPHRIPDVRLFRIRLFTKRIIQQLSVNTDIYFRPR